MATRNFALIIGIVFVAIGISGFVPGLVTPAPMEPNSLVVDTGYGYLMGLFPINIFHNIVHLTVGALGIISSRTPRNAWYYAVGLMLFYSLLAAMGFLPVLGTSMGLIPIFGHDIWLHAGTAFLAGYFAFVRPSPEVGMDGPTRQQMPGGAR
ncbi:DUF4383 domain-containing protein [Oculatella sp. LEGE 06141]|uniref:DUF4383 domain-containing protein n=1 Tax=Oculatella sp. LEGE 06141 TaxID=1828648 RepID=UPI0018828C9A|nr:DUF4383 domain-containing protein [Oculatella sp. LEGE 06141]